VVCTTAGALIYDLEDNVDQQVGQVERQEELAGSWGPTIAVMGFPSGPVTEMQAPHSAASSQFESDNAVPNIEEGSV
jgi:hypothetical protein